MSKRRRGGEPGRGNPHQQDRWVPPSKEERRAQKLTEASVAHETLSVEERLNIGCMSSSLPNVDMHGMERSEVRYEIDTLIENNPDAAVRVIYGKGKGLLTRETMQYLHRLQKQKIILGYKEDTHGASVVIITQ